MNLAMMQPWCSIGSDGSALAVEGPLRAGHPHPRSFGTFARVLGEYVRNRRLLRLEDAVRKMTSLNAAKAGLIDRGSSGPACSPTSPSSIPSRSSTGPLTSIHSSTASGSAMSWSTGSSCSTAGSTPMPTPAAPCGTADDERRSRLHKRHAI